MNQKPFDSASEQLPVVDRNDRLFATASKATAENENKRKHGQAFKSQRESTRKILSRLRNETR